MRIQSLDKKVLKLLAMRDEEFAKLREDIEYLDLVHRYL